jgi:hypothetical protein
MEVWAASLARSHQDEAGRYCGLRVRPPFPSGREVVRVGAAQVLLEAFRLALAPLELSVRGRLASLEVATRPA